MTQLDIQKIFRDLPDHRFAVRQSIAVRELSVDLETRVVKDIALTSDAPIFHQFPFGGSLYLILDHSPSSIDLERMTSDGPALWSHDPAMHVGRWLNPRIEGNKVKADCKFSRGVLGEEKFQDVQDGILVSISAGFYILDLTPELDSKTGEQREIDGIPVFRCFKSMLFESSFLTTPADISVGVGRSLDPANFSSATERNSTNEEKIMEPKENENPNPAAPAAGVETRTAADIAADNRLLAAKRVAEWGGVLGAQSELVTEYIRTLPTAETPTEEGLREYLKAKQPPSTAIPTEDPASAAARQGGGTEAQVLSLARSQYRGGVLKAFKTDADGLATAYRCGMALRAAFLPNSPERDQAREFCRNHGIAYNRTQQGNDNAKGGVFVIPEYEQAIIDLRIMYGVARQNADVVPMTSDTKIVHRRTGGLTAYPVGAGQQGTYSTATFDDIELVARKWMVLAKIEDELEEDAVISFADRLADEIAYAFTLAEDTAIFNGDGTSTYHGVVGVIPKITAATASIVTAAGNTFAEVTEANLTSMIGKLPQFARKTGNVKWFCSNVVWADVLERLALAKGGVTAAEIQGKWTQMFAGFPVEIVEVMPVADANSQIPLLFGNFSQAVTMGDRRGVTIKMTDTNDDDFERDLQSIKGTERWDANAHDVGNTSVAGPLIALQMAGS